MKIVDVIIRHVEGEKRAGKTVEQIQAAGLPKAYEEVGSGFIPEAAWIQAVYTSLDM